MITISQNIKEAAKLIKRSKCVFAFTGAGISVESGIPPFRGDNGLWNKYDPIFLDINYFKEKPVQSWNLNYEVFYEFFNRAKPNIAHRVLAKMEEIGLLHGIITQNIDSLHHKAGSKNVLEFHGSSRNLLCIKCGRKIVFKEEILENIPPYCSKCGGLLKPDYVFFGEAVPERVHSKAFHEAELSDLLIIIGTTGEVQPASQIPYLAKKTGAKLIEINVKNSLYTENIIDIYLEGMAAEIMESLYYCLETGIDFP